MCSFVFSEIRYRERGNGSANCMYWCLRANNAAMEHGTRIMMQFFEKHNPVVLDQSDGIFSRKS